MTVKAPPTPLAKPVADSHPLAVPGLFSPVVAPDQSFDALCGLELVDSDVPGRVQGRLKLREELRARAGGLHGGVVAAVAESLASRGTWIGLGDPSQRVMGLSNDTNHLSPLDGGHLNALAIVRERGRTQWLWEVQSRDDERRLCALTIVTIAVRAARPA